MMINLASCDVLKDKTTGEYFRVLSTDYEAGLIDLFQCHNRIKDCVLPFSRPLEEIHELITNNKFQLEESDPFARTHKPSSSSRFLEITKQTKAFFDVLEKYPIEDLLVETLRWQIIKEGAKIAKISIVTGFKWIKKYFNYGMTECSLDPNYERCGAPGEERNSGTPQKYRKYIIQGYKRFHLDKALPLKNAWRATKRKFKKQFEGFKLPEHVFRFLGERKYPIAIRQELRLNWKEYQNNHSLLRGRSNDIAEGPCVVYQIDSTVRDIQLVSSFDKDQFIGKATFYIVSDVWSRAIIAIYITLDNPSYISAANALYTALTDKTALYERVGLDLKHLQFNTRSLPVEIVADRAELLGPKADAIIKNLKIRSIGNTKRYSPIQKGNVEKLIDTVQRRVESTFLERGQVLKDNGKRGAKNTQEEACITLKQLIKITLITVDEYNNNHVIKDYPLTADMVKDKVNKIPAELYRWGIRKKLGRERHADQKKLWYSLLEQKEISASKRGVIQFNKQKYVPIDKGQQKIIQQHVLRFPGQKFAIAFDPRNYKNVSCLYQGMIIPLRLLGKDDVLYENEWEVIGSNTYYSQQDKELQEKEESVREINDEAIENIINENYYGKDSPKRKTKGASSAKSLERAINREAITDNSISKTKTVSKTVKSPKQKSKWLNTLKKANR